MGDSALETVDSDIGRNRRIVPTNVRLFGNFYVMTGCIRESYVNNECGKVLLKYDIFSLFCTELCHTALHNTAIGTT